MRKQRGVRPAGEDDAAGRPCTRLAAARAPPLLPSLRCRQVRNPGFAFQPRSPQRESQAVPSCHPWHMRRGPTGFPRRPPASSASNGTAVKWPSAVPAPGGPTHPHPRAVRIPASSPGLPGRTRKCHRQRELGKVGLPQVCAPATLCWIRGTPPMSAGTGVSLPHTSAGAGPWETGVNTIPSFIHPTDSSRGRGHENT